MATNKEVQAPQDKSGKASLLLDGSEDPRDIEKALEVIADFDYVRMTLHDINGVPRGLVLPAKRASSWLKSGVFFFSGTLGFGPRNQLGFAKEVADAHCPNVQIAPDLTTFHPIPWLTTDKYKVCELFCEPYWRPGQPQDAAPRYLARRMLAKLDALGFKLFSGMEWEYLLYDATTNKPVFSGPDYLAMQVQSEFMPWFADVDSSLTKAGVIVGAMHTEYCPGQFEMITEPAYGINCADQNALLKQCIKDMASKYGWKANFMAKPIQDDAGNGAHFNFSLWDKKSGENIFWDELSADGLSEVAKHWIGGILKHSCALTALLCPTVNCYRRLHKPWAPHQATWGIESRETTVRAKNNGKGGTYLENRLPSSVVNPYIALAATVAAGIIGMQEKTPCPSPYSTDEGVILPHSLQEALQALQEDVTLVEVLGSKFVEWFVQCKTVGDLKEYEGIDDDEKKLEKEIEQYSFLM